MYSNIHLSIFYTRLIQFRVMGGAGAYPRCYWVRGRVLSGQVAITGLYCNMLVILQFDGQEGKKTISGESHHIIIPVHRYRAQFPPALSETNGEKTPADFIA